MGDVQQNTHKATVKECSITSEKGQGTVEICSNKVIDVTSSSISAFKVQMIKKIATDFYGSRFISPMKRTSLTA